MTIRTREINVNTRLMLQFSMATLAFMGTFGASIGSRTENYTHNRGKK
ncbi:MAG: hypothetical protein V3U92_04145 [Cellulophaga sp.]